MLDFIRDNQLNIMQSLGSICFIISIFVIVTKTLSFKRKSVLLMIELSAGILLFADRFAYIYRGDVSTLGFYMVRISNYLTFAMTLMVVLGVVLYLSDTLTHEGGLKRAPLSIRLSAVAVAVGQTLLIISQFTGIYYTFDETNHYQRAHLFMISYVIPLLVLFLVLNALVRYRRRINRPVFISMLLFVIAPGIASIAQVFFYGISLTNISFVGMAVVLYIFVIIDMNETVERAHKIEMKNIQAENARMQRLFDQTATAFVAAVEKKDDYTSGNSVRIAELTKRIAAYDGKDEEYCKKAYYSALLHDVGLIGIPDSVIKNDIDPSGTDVEIMRKRPLIGSEILSSITEYPYLSEGAHYSHERYNGTGYPEGLKGEEIPEIARIIGVADAYVTMTSKKRYREARPDFVAREALIKGEGEAFDPKYAEIMIRIIDEDSKNAEAEGAYELERELTCAGYREKISSGILVEDGITKVSFSCDPTPDGEDNAFCAPSIILFDSYDRRVHDNERAIAAYKYTEYGEVWFDEHSIRTDARKFQETVERRADDSASADTEKYEILMGRYEDHLKLKMTSPSFEKEVIVALPDGSGAAYIAITGENCRIKDISVSQTDEVVTQDDIPRIVGVTSYIDRMESDVKNIQVDRERSASTQGIELKDRLRINFHTMSLPGASFVWHCPYIVIFCSDDGSVGGENYREYGLVKIYGENEGDNEFAYNSISMKKTEDFLGWDEWKEINKNGMECEVTIRRKDKRIILKTKNQGIEMENITTVKDDADKVFVALTGDRVAITDIRVR